MNKRFLFFLIACLCAIGVRADYALDKELTWEQVKNGNTFFAIVSGDQVLYGKGNQNTGMADVATAVSNANGVSLWKVETVSDGFLFRGYNTKGVAYEIWGEHGYLNAQPDKTGVSFILGLGNAQFTNGKDMANGAVWTVTATSDSYYIKNVGNDAYLNGTNTSVTADKKWKFYSVKEIPRDDFIFNGYDSNSDYTLRPIRQYGKNIVYADDLNKEVTLHGVMETPNSWFNNNRWDNSQGYNSDVSVNNCLGYFKTLLSAYVDNRAGSYCDLFRLHLDPAWTNDPSKTATAGGGENDISRFSAERLRTYMDKLYWPIIELAMAKGLYVIVRPPGVCPQNIKVGDDYYKYLMTVWDIVSKDERIKKYAGQVMIELANEPQNVYTASNQYSPAALHDFFQPIVDKIRSNGYKGVIWVPGRGYQWHYEDYTSNPITGDNIGYAVHFYPGWMGTTGNYTNESVITEFQKCVPVVTSYPIAITEVDWSPSDESGELDHYNEAGQPVYKNYGTWATGTTSQFGKAFRAVHDKFKNISMTITHPHEFFDFNRLFGEDYVTYSYQNNKEPKEACAYTCFQWYREWAKDHWMPGKKPAEVDKPYTLYSSMFHKWSGPSADATQIGSADCTYILNSPSDMIYGTSTVEPDCYADLTGLDKLYLTVTEGAPRLLFNQQVKDGQIPIEIPRDIKYQSVVDNHDGTKTYIIDIKQIVEDKGYAHLNAIKGAEWKDVIVTHMTFDYDVPEYYAEPFSYDTFASSNFNADERLLSSGSGGWTFADGLDLSQYKYLVVTSAQNRNSCKTSVYVSISDGIRTIEKDDGKTEKLGYTTNGNGLWFDTWNNNNIIIMNLEKMHENGNFDISSIKSLQFTLWDNPDNFYLNNVYATNTLPTYTGDYIKSVSTPENYGTICLPYAAACSGAFVYEVAGKKGNSVYLRRVNIMEAGKPYIYWSVKNYEGNKAEHKVLFYRASKVANDVAEPIINNGLVGTFAAMKAPKNQNCYVLSRSELYYVDSEVNVAANRAYLSLNEVSPLENSSKCVALSLFGGDADGISSVEGEGYATPVAFYTLSGVQLDSPQRGVNIVKMSDNTYRKVLVK